MQGSESRSLPAASPAAGAAEPLTALERCFNDFLSARPLVARGGRVIEVSPTHYRARGLSGAARLGDVVELRSRTGKRAGEIVQINATDIVVAPFEQAADAGVGDTVFDRGPFDIVPARSWRGRAVDALGRPIDGRGALPPGEHADAALRTPPALGRQRVGTPFATGVRVIDIFTPLCYGQRLGIFAGSGVGKSTLLAMLAAADAFDTVVV